MKLTEALIQSMIMRDRRDGCMPNYTPSGWWECDVFYLAPSGMWTEFEIKLSVSDFRADQQKSQRRRLGSVVDRKHDLLAERSTRGPNRFYFVVPEGLIGLDQVPEWAGLYEVRRDSGHLRLVTKKAPLLHREKRDRDKLWRHVERCARYRFVDSYYQWASKQEAV